MVNEPVAENAAEDQEVIRLAKARLIRVCRLTRPAAEQALARAATEQKAALVAVALRVLAAIPADLAAGRVLWVGRVDEGGRRPPGQQHQRYQQKLPQRKRRHGKR